MHICMQDIMVQYIFTKCLAKIEINEGYVFLSQCRLSILSHL
jgi:hypothetical protein